MIFEPTNLEGVFIVSLQPQVDERGSFARSWCAREFAQHGLEHQLTQCNVSVSTHRGTLRGLHYQASPHEEAKLVRVTRGAVFDVAVDLRRRSSTFGDCVSVELTAANHCALFLPAGCAHGLQTLSDQTEVFYQMSSPYIAEAACGIRWDDPDLAINWPLDVTMLSPRDQHWPTMRQAFADLAEDTFQSGHTSCVRDSA